MAYTTIDNPELYFQAKAWNGTGSEIAITFDGSENMQPDWVWLKKRSASGIHVAHDSVRGATKRLIPNSTDAETTQAQYVKSFDSNGITFGTDTDINASGATAILWGWKAGGSASSNSNGNITSSVSANTTAGFSIVSYTGNGTADATVGHGLGSAPTWLLIKNRTGTNKSWQNGHQSMGFQNGMYLNLTDASSSDNGAFNSTAPSSSVFTLGTSSFTNTSSDNYIAYCFAEKKGYSKFGQYEGNGNADGTFAYTGFKPAWIMIKNTEGTDNWNMYDNKRLGYNTNYSFLIANESNAENTTTSTANLDILSNGFKVRASTGHLNTSGDKYIYMAFAESPFVNSNGVPNNAR